MICGMPHQSGQNIFKKNSNPRNVLAKQYPLIGAHFWNERCRIEGGSPATWDFTYVCEENVDCLGELILNLRDKFLHIRLARQIYRRREKTITVPHIMFKICGARDGLRRSGESR